MSLELRGAARGYSVPNLEHCIPRDTLSGEVSPIATLDKALFLHN